MGILSLWDQVTYTEGLNGLGVPGRRYGLGEIHRGLSLSGDG